MHKNAAQQLGGSGDGGIDGVISEDLPRTPSRLRPGMALRRLQRGQPRRPQLHKGVFVTKSNFSTQARDFVRHLSLRVILIDGQTQADLIIEDGVGVRTSQTIDLKPLDEEFFTEDA